MKVNATVSVLAVRHFSFDDKETKLPVEMTEVVFKTDEGELYKVFKRGAQAINEGRYDITVTISPDNAMRPKIGVIEF